MKILVVSQYFYPENFRINELVSELVDKGHVVTVLTGQPNYPRHDFFDGYGWFGPRTEAIFNANIERVPIFKRGNATALKLFLNYLSFVVFGSYAALFRIPKGFDRVFVFAPSPIVSSFPGIIYKWRSGAPLYVWVLDLWPDSLRAMGILNFSPLLGLIEQIVRFIYRRCDGIFISSRGFHNRISALMRAPVETIYLPNWLESVYEPLLDNTGQNDSQGDKQKFTILFAGNIGDAQGVDNIIATVKLLQHRAAHIHWLFVGGGRRLDWLKQIVQQENLKAQVTIKGQVEPEAMLDYYRYSDALLLSLKDSELFEFTVPGKLQTYMCAGKPVLGMVGGETAAIIEEAECGFVCAPGDSARLAELALDLVEMPSRQRDKLGKNGQHYVSRVFHKNIVVSKFLEELK